MPRVRKCAICGQEFMSYNGNLCCSDECRLERKREQDRKSNYKRYHKLSNIPETKICPICGETFESLRNTYCSEQCSIIARNKQVKENNTVYYCENRREIINKNSIRQKEKRKKK